MYQIGEKVIYGIHGVCAVADIEHRIVDRKRITYLVLEPVNQSGARYLVPTHNQTAMSKLSPVLSQQELMALVSGTEVKKNVWLQDENARKQRYRELIGSGDRLALMQMCAALYRHRREQQAAGRRLHMCDENFLRDAEKLLCGEISLVMELSDEDARKLLFTNLNA